MSLTTTHLPVARALITLDQVDERRFRSVYNQHNYQGSIFGGQPFGQAVAAAQRTVPGWPVHHATGYFLRGASVELPVDYTVETMREGRRFAQRRVLATQKDKPVFELLASFHDPEQGYAHQMSAIGDVPAPEALVLIQDFVTANADRMPAAAVERQRLPFPVELKLTDPERFFFGPRGYLLNDFWFRMPSADAIDGRADNDALLAFLSDFWFAGAAASAHRAPIDKRPIFIATVNHNLWFHAPARVGDWLLYRTDSPWAGEGRGLVRGAIYDRTGTLVASAMQEISMRLG